MFPPKLGKPSVAPAGDSCYTHDNFGVPWCYIGFSEDGETALWGNCVCNHEDQVSERDAQTHRRTEQKAHSICPSEPLPLALPVAAVADLMSRACEVARFAARGLFEAGLCVHWSCLPWLLAGWPSSCKHSFSLFRRAHGSGAKVVLAALTRMVSNVGLPLEPLTRRVRSRLPKRRATGATSACRRRVSGRLAAWTAALGTRRATRRVAVPAWSPSARVRTSYLFPMVSCLRTYVRFWLWVVTGGGVQPHAFGGDGRSRTW